MSAIASPATEAARRRPGPLTLYAAVAVALPVVLGAFSRFQQRAFDSYVHMFFADHYARDWFGLFEPRWYGGFWVTSYPPLAHQLVALGSKGLGLEPAYVLVTAAAMTALPWTVGQLARTFADARAGVLAVLFAALFPTAARFAYVYGQLAMVVAAPLAIYSMVRMQRFLRSGSALDLLAFAACVGACAGTHHVSSLFVAGGCALLGLCELFQLAASSKGRRALLVLLGRGAVAAVAAAGAIYLVILPFWRFAAAEPQAEIPHFSRDPLWARPLGLDVAEQVLMLALGLFAAGWSVARRRWAWALVSAGVLVLATVSLGDTTPLPRLLFRSQYRWLTYDKFQFWAALLFAAVMAALLSRLRRRLGVALVALAAVLTPATIVSVGHKLSDEIQPEFVEDIAPLVQVLDAPGAERYRHLFLGFGDQFCRIDVKVRSPNVDGDYHTARTNPVLKQSGIGTLDTAKYYAKGEPVLRQVLSQADAHSLRWVFVTDLWYESLLLESGFELAEVWPNGVTLFERPGVPPLEPRPPPPRTAMSWAWGLGPPGCLLLAIALSLASERRRRSAPA